MYRTLMTLTLAQAFAQCAVPMVVLLGGIVGGNLAPREDLATLPVALMIVGTAACTIPASLLMARFGRKPVFVSAALVTAVAGVAAAGALLVGSFLLFCAACVVVGGHNAFIQQYRFAVAESVPAAQVGTAVSVLMLAGVVAAFTGPQLAQVFHDGVGGTLYVGSFLALSVLMLCAALVLTALPGLPLSAANGTAGEAAGDAAGRSWRVLAGQPDLVLAVAAAAVGYSVMSLIMTATPVSMHRLDGFGLADTTWVIQSHIMAMYLPSLFTAPLIARFGVRRVIGAGSGLLLACIVVAALDRHLMHYWWALVLLGVGWNFLFVGGTTLLATTYRAAERFRVQAFNDFMVFSLQALAALGSGAILGWLGWQWVLWFSLPWLLLLPFLLLWRGGAAKAVG